MKGVRHLLIPFGIAIGAVLAFGPEAAVAGTPITACEQVVTTSGFLTHDLGPCPGSGIVVGASGITIDLRGFTVRGDRSLSHWGIDDTGGYDGVTVENGVLRNFSGGVLAANGTDNVSVSEVVASGNVEAGIEILGDSASVTSSTASGNAGDFGIEISGDLASVTSSTASGNVGDGIVAGGASASVTSSTASGNGGDGITWGGASALVKSSTASGNAVHGIFVIGDSASVKLSTASGNAVHGIYVLGDAAVVKGNRAEANGFSGGGSDDFGLGIFVSNFTIAPTGTNVARGNDDPAECSPSSLC